MPRPTIVELQFREGLHGLVPMEKVPCSVEIMQERPRCSGLLSGNFRQFAHGWELYRRRDCRLARGLSVKDEIRPTSPTRLARSRGA